MTTSTLKKLSTAMTLVAALGASTQAYSATCHVDECGAPTSDPEVTTTIDHNITIEGDTNNTTVEGDTNNNDIGVEIDARSETTVNAGANAQTTNFNSKTKIESSIGMTNVATIYSPSQCNDGSSFAFGLGIPFQGSSSIGWGDMDAAGVDLNGLTLPEYLDGTLEERQEASADLSGDEKKVLGCLSTVWLANEQAQQHQINLQTEMNAGLAAVATATAKGSALVEIVKGDNIIRQIAAKHACNQSVVVLTDEDGSTYALDESVAQNPHGARSTGEHAEHCTGAAIKADTRTNAILNNILGL